MESSPRQAVFYFLIVLSARARAFICHKVTHYGHQEANRERDKDRIPISNSRLCVIVQTMWVSIYTRARDGPKLT